MDRTYEDLVSRANAVEGPRTLNVMNRSVYFPKTCGRILDTSFHDLCMKPLGAIDYLALCEEFDIIVLRDVPRMSLEQRSEARRFITMIDTFYDHKIQLICSAESKPEELFAIGNLSEWDRHHKRILIGDLDIEKGSEDEKASLFTGEEELFAFDRVRSRLTEMKSEEYWNEKEMYKTSGNRTIKVSKRYGQSS
ncbi:hypothetical protein LSH36_782g05020 [Paralvinella palmiformis]|uniref:AFG1-like ATPase n=1 Tax=Paralvinella palmiformis TaxID=53620 RepID=A0AAD9MU25_9ANNE|nr:hypothetical protein LSH36_782g05020 [Paralvinella palmiformis]